jgi:hypothetical protein
MMKVGTGKYSRKSACPPCNRNSRCHTLRDYICIFLDLTDLREYGLLCANAARLVERRQGISEAVRLVAATHRVGKGGRHVRANIKPRHR